MTISYKALVRLLLKLKHLYVVVPVGNPEEYPGRTIVKFMVADTYPVGPYMYMSYNKEDIQCLIQDRMSDRTGKTMLHFDMDSDSILSCCTVLYAAIREERTKILRKMAQKTQEVTNVCNTSEVSSAETAISSCST